MRPRPVALVTGSARRLGRAIALELAANGWDVAVHHRRSAADAERTVADAVALGARAHPFAADLADPSACAGLLPLVRTHFGSVRAVVNNASLFEYDSVADFDVACMERHWRANTAPAILLARALHDQGGGVVINLLDQKLWNPNPDYLSYTLSKAALQSATTLLAQALAPRTRVCGVAPGLILGSEFIDASRLQALAAAGPLNRLADAADVAAAVRFALSCDSMTGSTLMVDAGQHLRRQERDFAFSPAASARDE